MKKLWEKGQAVDDLVESITVGNEREPGPATCGNDPCRCRRIRERKTVYL